ncbi:MAG: hypothetical protein ACI9WC_000318 [Arenicella sp.]
MLISLLKKVIGWLPIMAVFTVSIMLLSPALISRSVQASTERLAIFTQKLPIKTGGITTLEGKTHYLKGDYIVYQNLNQTAATYAISAERFKDMYELVDDEN